MGGGPDPGHASPEPHARPVLLSHDTKHRSRGIVLIRTPSKPCLYPADLSPACPTEAAQGRRRPFFGRVSTILSPWRPLSTGTSAARREGWSVRSAPCTDWVHVPTLTFPSLLTLKESLILSHVVPHLKTGAILLSLKAFVKTKTSIVTGSTLSLLSPSSQTPPPSSEALLPQIPT